MNAVPDATFPTDNEYGIPTLLPKLQADYVDGIVKGWGTLARKNRHRGTWHFYVDDYKFENVWKHPELVTETLAVTTAEVNWSFNEQTPLAVVLYRIYQKRWLSRYWQSLGFRIFVDLNVPDNFAELNLTGVPRGWRAYATRAADAELDSLLLQAKLAKRHAGTDEILFLVCRGGQKVHEACLKNQWIHIPGDL